MLELKNVTKSYQYDTNAVPVLKGLNLVFRNAEFVSILGQSGCGKTTLLNIIGGLDHFTSGDLLIDGKSTKDYSSHDWDTYRNHTIGFVFQSYNLIPHQTVLQNVELALSIGGISRHERRTRAIEALKKVGLGEHINKKPNQLSGGQCQRVSIARAIVNNPRIILADEPTGALDSETSVQIMEILKEISTKCLVIMVTHNPDLAEQYSTRIVRMLDGVIQEDSHPVSETEYKEMKPREKTGAEIQKERKSAMSYWTSMMLSLKNLLTKKRRTFITALACSIGIIGIAVILSVSAGMQAYVNSAQLNSASVNYIDISSNTMMMQNTLPPQVGLPAYPDDAGGIYPYTPPSMTKQQILSPEYLEYIDTNITSDLVLAKQFTRKTNLNFVTFNGTTYAKTSTNSESPLPMNMGSWTEILNNPEYVSKEYTTLYTGAEGKTFPTEFDEIALVVDKYNRINTSVLRRLGISVPADVTKLEYSDIVDKEIRLVLNDDFYLPAQQGEHAYFTPATTQAELAASYAAGVPVKIVCILRQNENANGNWINTGIGYTEALTNYVLDGNSESTIVTTQRANPTVDIFSGADNLSPAKLANNLLSLGALATPSSVRLYPQNFDAKSEIISILDAWNTTEVYEVFGTATDADGKFIADQYKVEYSDISALLGNMMNEIINIITYALVAFSAISLVVRLDNDCDYHIRVSH